MTLLRQTNALRPTRQIVTVIRSTEQELVGSFTEPQLVGGYPSTILRLTIRLHGAGASKTLYFDYDVWGDQGAGPFANPQFVIPLLYEEWIEALEAERGGVPDNEWSAAHSPIED